MKSIFKKGDSKTINRALRLHHNLLKKFIELHGQPVLVHSPHDKKTFMKILKDGFLKIPLQHKQKKKSPYIEKLLNMNNVLYYSLGFAYATRYDFKYGLLFDLNYLRELDYYKSSIVYRCCKNIVDYWDRYNLKELKKLAMKNKVCKEVVDTYYTKKYLGKKKMIFQFWKIEKELYDSIKQSCDRKKLMKIIEDTKKERLVKYPYSKINAKTQAFSGRIQEIIGKKSVNLKTSPYFLGFYIKGKIPDDVMTILNRKYKGKLLFGGNNFKKIR